MEIGVFLDLANSYFGEISESFEYNEKADDIVYKDVNFALSWDRDGREVKRVIEVFKHFLRHEMKVDDERVDYVADVSWIESSEYVMIEFGRLTKEYIRSI